ncbi:MAG TPA: CoB--CoM heterodisulfide reductase iron-sulfur subunit B family protein [Syntrophomonadaceae bacterium]|jgi:heterodisulfide reductase subunit B|nr:CoB--CoM heterodisulfide reductase iron-sulfur subunit B family protein [Syntrophomonadaceae bacterium]HRX21139.1 CoB--CoM heterodisulfide reductase iron-sulfur subunit B family protein [Syntrophomonadaceae bacterium]
MRVAYYPGCSLEGSAIEYGVSTERTAEILGFELVEIDDWNCCGATSGHNTDKLLSIALPARNLAIAEKTGLNVLAPCAACYNRFRNTEHTVRSDSELKAKVEQVIGMEYKAENETYSILNYITQEVGLDKIADKVTKPLKGMKAACYYGCLLVRPEAHTGFDDAEYPQSMDNIVKALGAEAVEWAFKTECCGAALGTSQPEIGQKMIAAVLKNAKDSGAECIVTACPLCMMNLDMRQKSAEKGSGEIFNLPVYYVTELLAIACGDSPERVKVNKHFVEAVSYLKEVSKRAEEIAAKEKQQAEAKAAPAEEVDEEKIQKKIQAFIKSLQKNPDKIAAKLIEDEERAAILTEIVKNDEKKIQKLAELLATDNDKAVKAAEAYVSGELKKREKSKE